VIVNSPMQELRFQVYGTRMAVVRLPSGWQAFVLGPDGKRRPAALAVPDFIEAHELCQYLADILHESATPSQPDAYPID